MLDRPEDEVRDIISRVPPGARQDRYYSEFARLRLLREQQAGPPSAGREITDQARAVGRGLPFVGGFLDEATAGVNALPEPVGRPGGYDENVAYWRQRDKQFGQEHPVADPALGLVGGMVVPPIMRGAGLGVSALANTAAGAISGFGEGEGALHRGGIEEPRR